MSSCWIFARIWDREAYLFPGIVAAFAGVFICAGIMQNARWQKPLGIIWICLAGLAAFNSTQYEALTNLAVHGLRTTPAAVQGVIRASMLMSVMAATLGLSLLFWQRRLDRSGSDVTP
jgi:glucan phosphoethanolaminetransferase (alkaline phosphatase superfamily)